MQQYAYTKGCRRGFVLRYFGDPRGTLVLRGLRQLPRHARRDRGGRSRQRREARQHAEASDGVVLATNGRETPTKRRRSPGADEALLARLRDLRRTISREEQVPAYVVFPDRTLAEMAVRRPTTSGALGKIRGVGPASSRSTAIVFSTSSVPSTRRKRHED